MNLFVTTSVVLLVILVTMHYLAKVRAESLGAFFKIPGYLVLLAAVCLLAGLTYKGVRKMMHRNHRANMECSHMHGGMKMKRSKTVTCGTAGMNKMECSMDGGCCCCEGMGMMEKGHMRQGSERMKTESTTDTIDGKIIKKQIEIINK